MANRNRIITKPTAMYTGIYNAVVVSSSLYKTAL